LINPAKIFKLKGLWSQFNQNHPKFSQFLNTVYQNGLKEGTVFEITVTTPEGKTINSNMKLTTSDIELLRTLSEMSKE
jgi:hypothetical protein